MTEQSPQHETPAKGRMSKRRRILLVVSLSLNVLIVMAVVGAHFAPDERRGPPPRVKDLGGSLLFDALPDAEKSAFRAELRDQIKSGKRPNRQALRSLNDALLAALRAEPFDPVAVASVMEAIESARRQQLLIGQEAFVAYLAKMTPEQRQDMADAVEEKLRKGSGRGPNKP